jgi:hypothetical protein
MTLQVLNYGIMDVVENIRRIVREQRRSLRSVEREAGLPQARLTKLASGGFLQPEELERIAAALREPVWRIKGESGPPVPESGARAHLDELIARHGVEPCVRWILAGAAAAVQAAPLTPIKVPKGAVVTPPKGRRRQDGGSATG